VFDGATEEEIGDMLQLAYPDDVAKAKGLTATRTQAQLYDGRTGDAFERTTTVGYMHVPEAAPLGGRQDARPFHWPLQLVTQQPSGR